MLYKSPYPAFNDFVVQQFKGLPRFGSCDFYVLPSEVTIKQPEVAKAIQKKREQLKLGYRAFHHLVKIQFFKAYFSLMDKTALTILERDNKEDEIKSHTSQELLKRSAAIMATEQTKREYLCNPATDAKCKFATEWGGYGADDFRENEKYVSFVADQLEDLLQWSNALFKDKTETVYLVNPLKFVGSYDFDHNGFWVRLPLRTSGTTGMDYGSMVESYFFDFQPATPYGIAIQHKINEPAYSNAVVLLKVAPEKAEAVVNNTNKDMQIVAKVKLTFTGLGEPNGGLISPVLTFDFSEPIIEVYEDVALAEKIGELSLENLTYKEPD